MKNKTLLQELDIWHSLRLNLTSGVFIPTLPSDELIRKLYKKGILLSETKARY